MLLILTEQQHYAILLAHFQYSVVTMIKEDILRLLSLIYSFIFQILFFPLLSFFFLAPFYCFIHIIYMAEVPKIGYRIIAMIHEMRKK